MDANRIEDPERRMLKLKRLIHELPEHNFETFKHLAKHLNKVALYGDINKVSCNDIFQSSNFTLYVYIFPILPIYSD